LNSVELYTVEGKELGKLGKLGKPTKKPAGKLLVVKFDH